MLKISMHFPEKFIEYSKDHILDTVIKIYSGAFSLKIFQLNSRLLPRAVLFYEYWNFVYCDDSLIMRVIGNLYSYEVRSILFSEMYKK